MDRVQIGPVAGAPRTRPTVSTRRLQHDGREPGSHSQSIPRCRFRVWQMVSKRIEGALHVSRCASGNCSQSVLNGARKPFGERFDQCGCLV
jgi:hypothetical protein